MPVAAAPSPSRYGAGRPWRDRLVALVPAILLPLLLLLMLLRLGVLPSLGQSGPPALVTLSIKGEGVERARVVRQARRAAGAKPAPATRRAPSPVQASPSPAPSLNILHVGHDELAALDLAMATRHAGTGAADSGAGSGTNAESADASGGGGNGGQADQLFAADWYRRPSQAEMATYLDQAHAREGWGEVACRTAPRYRVEDCREIGESPGSGIARALREAAWQFQVLPPRHNGQAMVGTWVRIHFDVVRGFRG